MPVAGLRLHVEKHTDSDCRCSKTISELDECSMLDDALLEAVSADSERARSGIVGGSEGGDGIGTDVADD